MMTIEIRSAKKSERDIIYNLMQDYLHEFSAFSDVEKDSDGLYQYPYLDFYWGDPSRFPFLIRTTDNQQENSAGIVHRGSSSVTDSGNPELSSGIIAGFALLRSEFDPLTGLPGMEVSEFFVLPAYRNQGIGNAAAVKLWDQFPGQWTVRVLKANKAALPFWQHAIRRYTGGNYRETANSTLNESNITFIFENPFKDDLPPDIEPELLDY
ncbi:MAG: GNAT family N-acetyltransferase [Gammaproteobacteria bacterium]|nr:GNAT family N-acetyltransferase [Gammaproteobacteria bacterium]